MPHEWFGVVSQLMSECVKKIHVYEKGFSVQSFTPLHRNKNVLASAVTAETH